MGACCMFRAVRELSAESLNRLTAKAPEYMSSSGGISYYLYLIVK